jgi:hypothetical protein
VNPRDSKRLAALATAAAAAVAVRAIIRHPESRMNILWTVRSWIRPADRDSRWQQRSGRRIDPLDRLRRGI